MQIQWLGLAFFIVLPLTSFIGSLKKDNHQDVHIFFRFGSTLRLIVSRISLKLHIYQSIEIINNAIHSNDNLYPSLGDFNVYLSDSTCIYVKGFDVKM